VSNSRANFRRSKVFKSVQKWKFSISSILFVDEGEGLIPCLKKNPKTKQKEKKLQASFKTISISFC